jgi:hypothetical protein
MARPTAQSEPREQSGVLAWTAISLAVVALILVALGIAGAGGAGAGMVTSLIAFILAGVAWIQKVRRPALWLPLALFPVLLVTSPFWV